MSKFRYFNRTRRVAARFAMWLLTGAMLLPLNGCGVVALPCRVTSAMLKIVPVVGHSAATPLDACAAAID